MYILLDFNYFRLIGLLCFKYSLTQILFFQTIEDDDIYVIFRRYLTFLDEPNIHI